MADLAPSVQTMVLFVAALAATGVIAGLLAGLLGVGGGIVIVPVLYCLFDALDVAPQVSMHTAVGTSLATIVPTSIASMRAHHRKGAVDPALLRHWCFPVLAGAAAGAALAAQLDGAALSLVFACVALLVSLNIVAGRSGLAIAPALPTSPSVHCGLGGAVGAFSAMMGIGGGTLSVPVLSLFSYPMHRAVGTASALGLLIAVPGTAGYVLAGIGVPDRPAMSLGYVNLLGVAAIVPMTVLAAPVGARLAHWLDAGWLRCTFAAFLALTALRMFWRCFA